MTLRKIELMYQQFGKCEGHVCKECSNLTYNFYDKKYYSRLICLNKGVVKCLTGLLKMSGSGRQ